MLNIFRPSAAQPRQATAARLPADARGWCDEAGACEETGDWTRAVVCYRRALQLAPFAADIRQRFEDAVEQQILALERGPAKVRRVASAGEAKNNLFKVEEDVDADFELPDPPKKRSVRPLTDAPPQDEQRAPLRKPRNRNVVWIASACFAVLLTSAGRGTSSIIRGFFGNGGAPLLAEAKLPKALTERIARADKLITEEKTDEAAMLLLAAQSEFPANEADINRVLSAHFPHGGHEPVAREELRQGRDVVQSSSPVRSKRRAELDRPRTGAARAGPHDEWRQVRQQEEGSTHARTDLVRKSAGIVAVGHERLPRDRTGP